MKKILNTLTISNFISKYTNYIIHIFITYQLLPMDNLFAAVLSTGLLEM